MNEDELKLVNEHHNLLEIFLKETKSPPDPISASIKATINEFIARMKISFSNLAKENNGDWVSHDQIIQGQIDQLRECINTLNQCLTKKETMQ